jgi:hypothetical protein
MKNSEIIRITNAYQMTDKNLKLPVSVAWKRRLNLQKLMEARKLIDEVIREMTTEYLDDEHSVPTGNDLREIKPEYMDEYGKKIMEIHEQDTPVDIQKIASIEELGNVSISDNEMDTILFMVEGGDWG